MPLRTARRRHESSGVPPQMLRAPAVAGNHVHGCGLAPQAQSTPLHLVPKPEVTGVTSSEELSPPSSAPTTAGHCRPDAVPLSLSFSL